MKIINLRTDLADVIVEECWKYNHGKATPLRLLCEIVIVGAARINCIPYSIGEIQRYWRTNKPYWLGIPGYCLC